MTKPGLLVSQNVEPLTESPFLIHPVETNANHLYSSPVAILDFASLCGALLL